MAPGISILFVNNSVLKPLAGAEQSRPAAGMEEASVAQMELSGFKQSEEGGPIEAGWQQIWESGYIQGH